MQALVPAAADAQGGVVSKKGQVRIVQDLDPYQRYIVIYNELTEETTYPVISAPQGPNCNSAAFPSGTQLRILVNDGRRAWGSRTAIPSPSVLAGVSRR